MEALSAEKWSRCVDSEGRVLDQYNIRKIVFHRGIDEGIRHEVWPFLLGYYPFDSSDEERKRIDENKRKEYESLLALWSSPDHLDLSPDFEEDAKIIEKDSRRTDRSLEFFSDENTHNILMLERILKTFALLRPEIGYVQGMSDILALPLIVLNNEHQAFWCFDYIMKMVQGKVFLDLTLSEPLENLAKLCRHIDKPLFDHLDLVYEGEQWLFAYRLILLNFRRELSVSDCSRLWECYWSCHASHHFPLLFTVSVLVHFRDTLFQCSEFEQLMQFSQCLRGKIPVKEVLLQASELLEQLRSDDYCPYDIKFLLSNKVSAPPPLVGFVRTRQRVTSLYSRKFDVQKQQIWRALFGDTTPVLSITSPFMLPSPTHTSHSTHTTPGHTAASTPSSTLHTRERVTDPNLSERQQHLAVSDSILPLSPEGHRAPPKVGFVPRDRETFHVREDIRRLCHSNGYVDHSFVDESPVETISMATKVHGAVLNSPMAEPHTPLSLTTVESSFSTVSMATEVHSAINGSQPHRPTSPKYNSDHTPTPLTVDQKTVDFRDQPSQVTRSFNRHSSDNNGFSHSSPAPYSSGSANTTRASESTLQFDSQFDSLRAEPELTCH